MRYIVCKKIQVSLYNNIECWPMSKKHTQPRNQASKRQEGNKQDLQKIQAVKYKSTLDFLCHLYDKSVKWIGYTVIGIFVFLPALPFLRDTVKIILEAPEERIVALGDNIIKHIVSRDSMLPWIITAIFFGISLVLLLVCLLQLQSSRMHIRKIDELRKKLESADPGGRTSSGLDSNGYRP